METLGIPSAKFMFDTVDSDSTLLDFETIIKRNFKELKCFIKIFNYSSGEHNKYYMTFTRDTIKEYDIFFNNLFSTYTKQSKINQYLSSVDENFISPMPNIYKLL